MKSIIIISTLLFVTASFMGIGNYLRYNDTFRENGLYAPPQEVTEKEIINEPSNNLQSSTVKDQTEVAQIEEPVQHPIEKKKVSKTRQQQSRNTQREPVLHAAKKPTEREINFKGFSRAALDDEPAPIVKAVETSVTTEAEPTSDDSSEEE